MTFGYLYSKFFKKILRGKSVLNSRVDKTARIYSGTEFYNSSISRYSYVGYDSEVHNCDIGAFCSIANNFVVGGANHPYNWVSTSPCFYKSKGGSGFNIGDFEVDKIRQTTIGNDVWIGSRVLIMQGLSIGNGAVIGAGSVVTKDVPPYAIVCGVPAKIIKYRFDNEVISMLQKLEWWNWPVSKLKQYSHLMNNVRRFLMEFDD